MRKRALLVTFIILLTGFAGFIAYSLWYDKNNIGVWSFVPDNAFAVYETQNTVGIWNDLISSSFWKTLSDIPGFKQKEKNFELLDSISGKDGSVDELLKNKNILISCHVTSGDDFDFIFYVPLNDPADFQNVLMIIDKFQNQKTLSKSVRTYQGFNINEITEPGSNAFSYILYQNHFVGSFNSILIDDVIRTIKESELIDFQANNEELFQLSKLENDKGNLYINFDNLIHFIELFTGNDSNEAIRYLQTYLRSSFLDITFDNTSISLQGISFLGSEEENFFLWTLGEQAPGKFRLQDYLPNSTSLLFSIHVDNGLNWKNRLEIYWNNIQSPNPGIWENFSKNYNFDVDRFFNWINGEVGLVKLETVDQSLTKKLLFLESKDINETLNQMNTLAERISDSKSDSVYYEEFADIQIRQLDIKDFPAKMFGPVYSGFDFTFYTILDDFLVFSSSIEALKHLVNDLDNENTWGKSVEQVMFLENTMEEYNVTFMLDIPKAWNFIISDISPAWHETLIKNSNALRKFEKTAIQLARLDDRFYTSTSITHSAESDFVESKEFDIEQQVHFNNLLVTKPFVVRSHIDNSFEVLVQDSSNHLHLISKDGEKLWEDSISGSMHDNVEQIDFYKNENLQYLFSTDSLIYLIDRNGEPVHNYPLKVDYKIDQFSVIDYDKSKRYRIISSDDLGNIYMYDQYENVLDGWDPNVLNGKLTVPPIHLRVRGSDFIAAVQENGIINIFNRRGKMIKGFPVDLKSGTSSNLFVQIGPDLKNTILTTVTINGEIVKLNLEGLILNRQPLFKPSKETEFTMIEETSGSSFIIAQQDYNRLSLLDNNGKLILEKDYLSAQDFDIQYYNFGSGKNLFAVTDPVQDFTYLYDEKGNLVNFRPLESGHPIGLIYYRAFKKFHVYKTYNNIFTISSFYSN